MVLDPQLAAAISAWSRRSLAAGEHVLATSNQGTVLLYADGKHEFVVKTAMGRGVLKRARKATLVREYRAYQRLTGLAGVPACYGLLDGRFLVLERIHGHPYREAEILDRETWFAELLAIIQGFHARGVAHGDLKSKSNLVMTDAGRPCVIDFGTTVLQEPAWRWFNNWMFSYARQLDLNAWVKHKYQGNYEGASDTDRELLRYSFIERWLRDRRRRRKANRTAA